MGYIVKRDPSLELHLVACLETMAGVSSEQIRENVRQFLSKSSEPNLYDIWYRKGIKEILSIYLDFCLKAKLKEKQQEYLDEKLQEFIKKNSTPYLLSVDESRNILKDLQDILDKN